MSTDPLRDLAEAVLEALDIPHPATLGDREAHDRILTDRISWAKVTLRAFLDDPDAGPASTTWTTRYLRERLAEHPPTGYRHAGEPAPASCGRCRKPFDPTDTAHDGAARHRDTPWCRRCVDRCHESTDAFHACPVCDPARYGGEAR